MKIYYCTKCGEGSISFDEGEKIYLPYCNCLKCGESTRNFKRKKNKIKENNMKIIRLDWLPIAGITIYPFIFVSTDAKITWEHEEVHYYQQEQWYNKAWLLGLFAWFFLYLFCLPILFNPFRRRVEREAYKQANKLSDKQIDKLLKSKWYGWLI